MSKSMSYRCSNEVYKQIEALSVKLDKSIGDTIKVLIDAGLHVAVKGKLIAPLPESKESIAHRIKTDIDKLI